MVKIKLASIPIQMDNRFPQLEELCRGYETQEAPMMILSASQEEIDRERGMQQGAFSDGYLETICLYRKLALEMLQYNVFVMHASVIAVDGRGYAFLAPSGTGKTTQTRLWLEYFGHGACVVNGDKPLIRMVPAENGYEFIAYGTPWCGKEGMNSNCGVPLVGMFLVERASVPSCVPASQELSVPRVFRQLLLPKQPEQMDRMLTLADHLMETVPCFLLRCNMEPESVAAAFEAVRGLRC